MKIIYIFIMIMCFAATAMAECEAHELIKPWRHEVTGMATDGLLVDGPCYITSISHSWGECKFWLYDGNSAEGEQFYEHTSILLEKDQHGPLLCPEQIKNGVYYKVDGLCSVVIEYAKP